MPRYFYHVISKSGPIFDEEGTGHDNVAQARDEALADIRELIADAAKSGIDISGRRMEIRDASGALLTTLRFTDALVSEDL
ncbi:hypothetical protein SB748_29180 [Rhizobium sp. SIMBA_035]